jgi:hypothetical protein
MHDDVSLPWFKLMLLATVYPQDGRTAVMVAAFGGNAEIVTFLARSGADVNAVDNVSPDCCDLVSMAHCVRYPLLYGLVNFPRDYATVTVTLPCRLKIMWCTRLHVL